MAARRTGGAGGYPSTCCHGSCHGRARHGLGWPYVRCIWLNRSIRVVDYYDVTLFNRAYDWMKARGMSEGQSRHAALVVG